MPEQIRRPGERRHDDDPVTQLLRCHERIREFTALAGRLAPGEPASEEELAEAAAAVRRYFTVALPRHERDEEDSIVPALQAASAPAEVTEALAAMTAQHRPIDAIVAEAEPLWRQLAEAPGRRAELGPRLHDVAARLKGHFDAHLPAEERVIFPALARLPAPVLEKIRAEMRARRDK